MHNNHPFYTGVVLGDHFIALELVGCIEEFVNVPLVTGRRGRERAEFDFSDGCGGLENRRSCGPLIL